MSAVWVTLVLLLPALLGVPLVCVLESAEPGGVASGLTWRRWLTRIATGWVIGVPLCGLLLRAANGNPPMQLLSAAAPWLLLHMGIFWGWTLLRWRSGAAAGAPVVIRHQLPEWRWLWWLLLALLLLHGVMLTLQALWLPTLTWDSWTTWIGRPRAWVGMTGLDGFQTLAAWQAAVGEDGVAALAPHYPESVSRYLMLLVSAYGTWSESLVHLPWPLFWLCSSVAIYSAVRDAGQSALIAMGCTFAVFSMPLVDTHFSLAGYLDFWVGSLLALAAIALLRWRRHGKRRDLCRALLFAMLLPLLKLEGAVWLLVVLALVVWLSLSKRWRWTLIGAVIVALLVSLPLGGLPIPAPGLGMVWLRWGGIDVPGFGQITLSWHPVLGEVLASLFVLPNWHLLWWLLPLTAVVGRRRVLVDPGMSALALLVLSGLGFIGLLFFFTDAAAWAENLTSINRIVLQLAPSAAVFMVLLMDSMRLDAAARFSPTADAEARIDTARSSDG